MGQVRTWENPVAWQIFASRSTPIARTPGFRVSGRTHPLYCRKRKNGIEPQERAQLKKGDEAKRNCEEKKAAEILRHENHHGFCSQTHPCNSSTSNANLTKQKLHNMRAQGTPNIANDAHNCSQSNPITGSNFPNNSINTDYHQHHKKFKIAATTISPAHTTNESTPKFWWNSTSRTKFPRRDNNIGRSSPADHSFRCGGTGWRQKHEKLTARNSGKGNELLATTLYRYCPSDVKSSLAAKLWRNEEN